MSCLKTGGTRGGCRDSNLGEFMKDLTFRWYDTGVFIGELTQSQFMEIIAMLRVDRKFNVKDDPKNIKHHPSLVGTEFIGRRYHLRFHARHAPKLSEIKFFQELVRDNPNGGYYDFGKLEKMPPDVLKFFKIERRWLTEVLKASGRVDETERKMPEITAYEWLTHEILKSGHYRGDKAKLKPHPFKTIWTSSDAYNCKDRDGKQIRPWQTKCFYDWDGRLKRGHVVKNLNNMWWVITGRYSVSNVSASSLFDYSGEPKRSVEWQKGKMRRLMAQASEAHDYERAAMFRNLIGQEVNYKKDKP